MNFPLAEIKAKFVGNATLAAALVDSSDAPAVFLGYAPENTPLPYATIQASGLKKEMTFLTGFTQPVDVRFTIYSNDETQIQALHQAVQSEFERAARGARVLAYQPLNERLYLSSTPYKTGEVVYVSVNAYRATVGG